jgi:bacillopeptidase F (M6 metalloprotease family)
MEIALGRPQPEPWTVLGLLRDVDRADGFQQWSFDLTQFAGQTVTLRFNAYEDNGSLTSFLIDDVELNMR